MNTASTLLALIGASFVVLNITHHSSQIDISRFDAAAWIGLGILSVAYGASNALLARAWWQLLNHFCIQTPWSWALKSYGVSQINKYLPGNIFHLAGRQIQGIAAGLAPRPLAHSTLWELVLLALLGSFFGILALPLGWPQMSATAAISLWASLFIFGHVTLRHAIDKAVALAMLLQGGFLLMSGTVFTAVFLICSQASGVPYPTLPVVCGAYVLAWLAGLVVPGAPAGLGVREAVLLLLLGRNFPPADLLLAVTLGRGVTASGDFLFYLYAICIKDQVPILTDFLRSHPSE